MNAETQPISDRIWDVIVVGTGMGGATLGHALAKAGRTVLFVEAGQKSIGSTFVEATPGYGELSEVERSNVLMRGGRVCEPVDDGEGDEGVVPFMGLGTGGSSALYGMALERFFPQDFDRWPVSYQEMLPWYEAAERLYRIRGTVDPLRQESVPDLLPPPALSKSNSIVFSKVSGQGLHPYRLHLGCERLDGCQICQGHVCPRQCKNDSRRICLEPALRLENAQMVTESPARSLEMNGRRVTHVVTPTARLAGRVIVLAAGALVTPGLMPASANRSGCVGRYYMRHAIDLFALRKAPLFASGSDSKEMSFNDFYQVDEDLLGNVQSFGPLPPVGYLLDRPGRRWYSRLGDPVTRLLWKRAMRTPVLAAILQDDPREENHVCGRQIHHRLGDDDLRRQKRLRQLMMDALRPLGAMRMYSRHKDRAGLAHSCGTCRFGHDPGTSALDSLNRAHDIDNLYVVDASFFPTSGGVGPALTVAANALRVAEHMDRIL